VSNVIDAFLVQLDRKLFLINNAKRKMGNYCLISPGIREVGFADVLEYQAV
jgi:hypothetical protein